MSLTVVLGIVAAIVVVASSAFAGHLTAEKKLHKWFFWLGGGVAIVLIGLQTYVNDQAQAGLVKKIDEINQNTQVNLHTNVDILSPDAVTGNPYFPFRAEQTPTVAIRYVNPGSQAANDTLLSIGLNVVPYPLSETAEQGVWAKSGLHGQASAGGTMLPKSPSHYNSVSAGPLTADEARALTAGTLQLCATARVVWKDKTGGYCRYSFQCFHREAGIDGNQAFFNWHAQGVEYNREEKCTIEGLGH